MQYYQNNTYDDIYNRPVKTSSENKYYTEKEQTRSIPENSNGMFASFIDNDFNDNNLESEQNFRYSQSNGVKNLKRPFSSQLPYHTTPKSYVNPDLQMIPEPTRISNQRVCFNDAVNQSGPWYLRQWPIWDNYKYLPSAGDVTKDPRYSMQTKGFLTEYRRF